LFGDGSVQFARDGLDRLEVGEGTVVGLEAGDGFDAADAGGDGAFTDDAEVADFTSAASVGAAAEFHGVAVEFLRVAADLDDADLVAVFFTEEMGDIAAAFHFGVGNFDPAHRTVFDDAFVHEAFDVADLLRCEWGAVEVEREFFRANVGTFLECVLARDFVQGPVEKVRDGVVTLDGVAAFWFDGDLDFGAD
jgi:hypothetical protein